MKRAAAITVLLGVFAVHFPSQAKQGTKANQQTTSPCPTSISFINNQSSNKNADCAQNNSPHWYASPEWWLVIVAIPTLFFIWYEAKKTAEAAEATRSQARETAIAAKAAADSVIEIRRQADIMAQQTETVEKSAKAALLNAKAIINTERPWLVVTWKSKPDWPGAFLFGCKNRGNTPAKIVSMSAKHLFIDKPDNLPVPPDYSSPITMPDLPFKIADDDFEIGNGLDARSIVINSQKEESVQARREFLVYYGNVVYKDTFFPDSPTEGLHETRWCFVYQAGETKSLTRSGPEEYNRYT